MKIHLEAEQIRILSQVLNTVLRVPFVDPANTLAKSAPLCGRLPGVNADAAQKALLAFEERLSALHNACDIDLSEEDVRNAILSIASIRAELTHPGHIHTYIGCWPADLDSIESSLRQCVNS